MEAATKTKNKTLQWKQELMNTNAVRARENTQEVNQVVLNKDDYNDLIHLKEKRATKVKNQSRMFFFIGLSLALMMTITAFEWKFVDEGTLVELGMLEGDFDEIQDIPQTQQAPPPPPQQIIKQPVVVEVPDEVILEEIEVDLDVEVTEDMAVDEVIFEEEAVEEEVAEEIFLIVEDKPEPKGGMSAFYKYVGETIKYPDAAKRMNIQGRVFVQFVVNKEGQISDVVVVKGIGGGCDEEAIRILENAPAWTPGRQRGKAVSVRMVMPITFKLANR